MKNILVPTDFSDCARRAENLALEIAEKAGAEIHFLHIFDSPVDWVKLPLEREELYPETRLKFKNANRELNDLVKRAKEKGLKAEEFLLFNEGRAAIDDHIKSHNHDFIVMGSHGAKGIKELLGSNTQKVVRYANAPVLVVKESALDRDNRNLVFASSFNKEAMEPFQRTVDFANMIDAKIHLLYVNTPNRFIETDEIESKMQEFLKEFETVVCTQNIYDSLNAERGILKFSEKVEADIIAVATHGRTGFLKLLSPSITENLVNHSDRLVLSINISD